MLPISEEFADPLVHAEGTDDGYFGCVHQAAAILLLIAPQLS